MKPSVTDISTDKLFDEFNTVIAEAERLLKAVGSAGSERAGTLKAGVEQGLASAVESLTKVRDDAFSQASTAVRATDEYVQDNPWRAIGIVAAASAISGFAVGLLMARR